MTNEIAKKILDHLIKHNLGFCFLNSTGELVTREQLQNTLEEQEFEGVIPY